MENDPFLAENIGAKEFKIEREISFKSFKLYSLLLSEIFEIGGFLNNQNRHNFFSIAPKGLKFCMHGVSYIY